VGTLETWLEVTTAADHSCALREEGSVWCFGANDQGQLGLPGVNDVLSPTALTLDATAQQVSAEAAFSCALLQNGRVYCWGQNTEGMLAQDDTYPGEDQFVPLPVTQFDDWSSLDTGNGHACALRAPGTLWCWGRNSDDQLGLGESADAQFRYPQQVQSASDWLQVQAGQNHSCGLRRGGGLWCWGDNEFGNLGTGDFTPQPSPVRIDAREYVQVSLDTFHTCAIDTASELWCWGRNIEGQLGLGDIEDRVLPARVATGNWAQVAVGRFHTCATKHNASIWCTGENAVGQLGSGDTERRQEFTQVELAGP
jgi:alpha-tubulin suppressor-like RCC1 family protein